MDRFTSPSLHVKDVLIAATLLAASALPASAQQDLEQCRWQRISRGSWAENRDGVSQLLTSKTGCQNSLNQGRGEVKSATVIKKPANGTLTLQGLHRLFYVPKPGATTDEAILKFCGTSPAGSGCSNVTYKIVIQ